MKVKGMMITVAMAMAVQGAMANLPTAFDLLKSGDQYVGVQSKGKIVQIRSDKSVGGLTPQVWYVVYYDPNAMFKASQVKFDNGQETEVTHPGRLLELATDQHKPFDSNLLKIDSDRAIQIAASQPYLNTLTLTATKLSLDHGELGPVWHVEIWATRGKSTNPSVDIGEVVLSATDGAVIENDLHPNRVD
jgi:hypothetical protein